MLFFPIYLDLEHLSPLSGPRETGKNSDAYLIAGSAEARKFMSGEIAIAFLFVSWYHWTNWSEYVTG